MNSNNKKSSGGFKGLIATGVTLVLLASALMGVAKVNSINSPTELFAYFKSHSDRIWECTGGSVEWNCETPIFGGSNGSGGGKGTGDGGNTGEAKSPTAKDESLKKLEALTVAEPQKIDYERSEWKHWTGSPCNTREEVLKEQGSDVKADKDCKIVSGTWVDPYSGDTFTDSSKLDIDHVISLSYSAKHGGQEWSAEQKEAFANDKTQLLVSSASENRSKGDSGPGEYMPKEKSYHCEYSKIWVDTATKYDLTIGSKDKKALEKGLNTCDS